MSLNNNYNNLFNPYVAIEQYNKQLKEKNKSKVKPKKILSKSQKVINNLPNDVYFNENEELYDKNCNFNTLGDVPLIPTHTPSMIHSNPNSKPSTTSKLPNIRNKSSTSDVTYDSERYYNDSKSTISIKNIEKEDMNLAYLSSVNELSIQYKKEKILLEKRNVALQTQNDNLESKINELKAALKIKDEKLTQLRKSLQVYLDRDERTLKVVSLYDPDTDVFY